MAETNEPPENADKSAAEVKALLDEAEAEAAAAAAVAAAAQARARAARLRRKALGLPEPAKQHDHDYEDDENYDEYDEDEDYAEGHEDYYDEDYYDDEDYDESVAEQPAWRARIPAIATVVTIILIICFAGVSVYMARQHRDTTRHHQREAAFVAGAKKGVINMISLDFNRAKEDVQRVIDGSTGPFKADFQQRANDLILVVTREKTVTQGRVNAAALESMERNSAVVLVSATSQVTNSPPGSDEPARIWRLRVTVADVGGQYKMSKVEYIP
jgi:Mce-associated membrane protein